MATQYRVVPEDQQSAQRPVLDTLNAPPGGEAKGDRYLVGTGSGAWAGHDEAIATYTGAAWIFDTPAEGWETYCIDEAAYLFFNGAAWVNRPVPTQNSLDVDGTITTYQVLVNPAPTTDHTAVGFLASFTAGETLAAGNAVYLKSDGKVWKADADAATTMPAIGIIETGGNADATVTVLTHGFFRDDTWDWTVGGLVYVDTTTAGGLTQTAPSGTGDQVQVFGQATHADRILVMPSLVLVEVA